MEIPIASDYGTNALPTDALFDELHDAFVSADGGVTSTLYVVPESRVSKSAAEGYRQYAVNRRYASKITIPDVADERPYVVSVGECASGDDCPANFSCGPVPGSASADAKTCRREFRLTPAGLKAAMKEALNVVPNGAGDNVHAFLSLRSARPNRLLAEGLVSDDLARVLEEVKEEEARNTDELAAELNVDPLIIEWQRRLALDVDGTHRIVMLPLTPDVEAILYDAQQNGNSNARNEITDCVYSRPVVTTNSNGESSVQLETSVTQRTPVVCACQQVLDSAVMYGGFTFKRVADGSYQSSFTKELQGSGPENAALANDGTSLPREPCPPSAGCPPEFASTCSATVRGQCVGRFDGANADSTALRDAVVGALVYFDTPQQPMAMLYVPGTCGEPFDPSTDFYWDAAALVVNTLPDAYADSYRNRGFQEPSNRPVNQNGNSTSGSGTNGNNKRGENGASGNDTVGNSSGNGNTNGGASGNDGTNDDEDSSGANWTVIAIVGVLVALVVLPLIVILLRKRHELIKKWDMEQAARDAQSDEDRDHWEAEEAESRYSTHHR